MSETSPPMPVLAVTCGDPTGIGLEVLVKALHATQWHTRIAIVLHAAPEHLAAQAPLLEGGAAEIADPERWQLGTLDRRPITPGLWLCPVATSGPLPIPGAPTEETVRVMRDSLDAATNAALGPAADALLTPPITKDLFGEESFPGQTEWLAHRAQASSVAMMLAGPTLRVVPVTTHLAIRDVADALTPERITRHIQTTDQALREDFGIPTPRIAICALNPHGGEGGRFGDEEERILAPAIARARDAGLEVDGPIPADTLFAVAPKGPWDAILTMYHDQGLIPFKMLHFDEGVNVTLGLPFVRTSPDHGVAHDIAGLGKARPDSMIQALKMAVEITLRRTSSHRAQTDRIPDPSHDRGPRVP